MTLPGLKSARLAKGLTQGELAGLVGRHRQHVYRVENGVQAPSGHLLKRLAEVLGVSTDYLLYGPEGARTEGAA